MARRPSSPFGTPIELWRSWLSVATLVAEAQTVVAMRLWGMAGLWAVAPGETHRMTAEKLPAFTEAAQAAVRAGASGQPPVQVLAAAVRPLRKRTKSNARRLARRGPRNPRLPRS